MGQSQHLVVQLHNKLLDLRDVGQHWQELLSSAERSRAENLEALEQARGDTENAQSRSRELEGELLAIQDRLHWTEDRVRPLFSDRTLSILSLIARDAVSDRTRMRWKELGLHAA